MAGSQRLKRMADTVQRELSELIRQELKDPRLGGLVTISAVKVSPDLGYAEVYVTVMGRELGDEQSQEANKETLDVLNKASGFLRHELSRRIKTQVASAAEVVGQTLDVPADEIVDVVLDRRVRPGHVGRIGCAALRQLHETAVLGVGRLPHLGEGRDVIVDTLDGIGVDEPGGAHDRLVRRHRECPEHHRVVAAEVEPRVGLVVQRHVTESRVDDVADQLLADLLAVPAEGGAVAVEWEVGDPEPGGPVVELAVGPLWDAGCGPSDREAIQSLQIPLVQLLLPRGHLGHVGLQEREVGAGQLGVAGIAVQALPVVLHDQLPVALFHQVGLVGNLQPAQLERGQVRLDLAGDLVEVGRWVIGQADEDQAGHRAYVDSLEPELRTVESLLRGFGVDQRTVGSVGPLVVGADQVADRAAGILDDP